MAKEESFMLVSLEESKAKKLAQVISNDTSRKILDLLAKKDATETEISKELKVPLSTIHYNLKALTDAHLVKVKEFHYSQKGKEVNHYSLANKLIIIAPKETKGLKSTLKKFLPLTLISIGGAALIYLAEFLGKTANALPKAATFAAQRGMEDEAMAGTAEAAPMLADAAVETVAPATQSLPFAFWFLIGALFVIILFIIFEIVAHKRRT